MPCGLCMLSNGKHSQSDEYMIGYDRHGSVDSDACHRWCFVTKTTTQALTWICLAIQGALGEGIGSHGHQTEQESTQHLLQSQLLLPLCALVIV